MAQNLFTGKDVGALLPSGQSGQRAQENMSSMFITAEKLKADVYRKNSEEFQKASNIDPVFVLADSAQKTQMGLITEFNKKWGTAMQQAGGNLSDTQKMQMTTDKNVVIMQQQKMQSDSQMAMEMRDAVSKDVQGNLDHNDVNRRLFGEPGKNDGYYQTGTLDTSPLLPSAINPDEYFNKPTNKVNGTPSNVTVTKNIAGIPYKETYQASGSEQEGRDMVATSLHGNPRVARGYIEEFQKLKDTDPEMYKRYLDTNNDGKVSPSEENATKTVSNPILQWAQDNYWHKALDMRLSQPTKVATGASKGYKFNFGGQEVTAPPAVKRRDPINYGDQNYINTYAFPKPISTGNVPTKGGIKYTRNSSRPLGDGNIQGVIKDYIPDGDLVTIEVKKAYGAANVESGEFVAVPASSVPDVNSLPIIGEDGKSTTVGSQRSGVQATPPAKKKAY